MRGNISLSDKCISPDFYHASIADFCLANAGNVFATIQTTNNNDLKQQQSATWETEIKCLQDALLGIKDGSISFEYNIPRLGKRIDVVILVKGIVFVLEFKDNADKILTEDVNQVWDYALDLKNFHSTSHTLPIVPVLVGTNYELNGFGMLEKGEGEVYRPLIINERDIASLIHEVSQAIEASDFDYGNWRKGVYSPTPTIIDAARTLYSRHSVAEIKRADADAKNLTDTCAAIDKIIERAKENKEKIVCFVTGVPGAGKTLVGLNVATSLTPETGKSVEDNMAVYLSGNGPLVKILCEALTRDACAKQKALIAAGKMEKKSAETKKSIGSKINKFIQAVHHFIDAYLIGIKVDNGEIVPDENYWGSPESAKHKWCPPEHITIFDEAQRAWNHEMLFDFMKRKKHFDGFPMSQPEFLISCMDRRDDWAVVVCLVGEGQEINRGEMGINGWVEALQNRFSNWKACISEEMFDERFGAKESLTKLEAEGRIERSKDLHLSVSLRSFRSGHLASFVQSVLDHDIENAKETYNKLEKYPIVLTRDIDKAKSWLRVRARGTERYGLVVSSQAYRLKPMAIDVRVKADPVLWFLNDYTDIRSSYYMEDVATEFDIQGLELDWVGVVWDGDFRSMGSDWANFSFKGSKWQKVNKEERKQYQKNAYRVLLTRARQGMVICVPKGSDDDPTRKPAFYDSTYNYLKSLGVKEI